MRRYARDPHWITARYATKCDKCAGDIKRGADAFYYPNGKLLYCDKDNCGGACSRDFTAMAQDEETYAGY